MGDADARTERTIGRRESAASALSPGPMDERSRRVEQRFENPLMLAAVLVIPVAIAQQAKFGAPWNTLADVLNWAIWLAFAVELVVMLAIVPDRWRWLADHPIEVVVVLFTMPLLLSALQPLRALRVLRLLRLLRLAPLVRFLFTRQGIRYSALLVLLTAVSGGAAFAELEKGQSLGEGLYWAIMTMTTVGADVTARTEEGKVLSAVLALVGISFVAVLTGAIAQRFLAGPIERAEEAVSDELELAEAELLGEIREIAGRFTRLERDLERSMRTRPPGR